MDDHHTPDPIGQPRRVEMRVRHRSRPNGGGHDLTIAYTAINDADLTRILDALDRISSLPALPPTMREYLRTISPAARARAHARGELQPGGRPPEQTYEPDF